MWMNDLWHKDKVIIGMLHLDAMVQLMSNM